MPLLPNENKADLRIYNGEECPYKFTANSTDFPPITTDALDFTVETSIHVGKELNFEYKLTPQSGG